MFFSRSMHDYHKRLMTEINSDKEKLLAFYRWTQLTVWSSLLITLLLLLLYCVSDCSQLILICNSKFRLVSDKSASNKIIFINWSWNRSHTVTLRGPSIPLLVMMFHCYLHMTVKLETYLGFWIFPQMYSGFDVMEYSGKDLTFSLYYPLYFLPLSQ